MSLLDQQISLLAGIRDRFLLVDHPEPRYSVFADAEAQSTRVWVTYKHDRKEVVCVILSLSRSHRKSAGCACVPTWCMQCTRLLDSHTFR
jgi:hypothetical protein